MSFPTYPMTVGASNLPAEQGYRETYSPTKGKVITRRWKGKFAGIQALANTLIPLGYEYDLQQLEQGGFWLLTGTIGADLADYSFEVDGEERQIDILSSTLPDVQNLSDANIQVLRAYMDFYADLHGQTPTPVPGTGGSEAASFNLIWQNILAGFRVVPGSFPVIRRSYIASRNFAIAESYLNVNGIYSKASLISEGVPETYWGILPESGPTTIGQLAVNAGYVKKAPRITTNTYGRIRIDQSWRFDYFSTLLGGLI